MKVDLLSYTPDALDILLMTKQTRLAFSPGLLEEIRNWPMERKLSELAYMRGTIQSSWEFVDYMFLLEGVSRAFTHQLVRTRAASYAQQSQRTVDMSGFDFVWPEVDKDGAWYINQAISFVGDVYRDMVKDGVKPEDARSILPTNVATSIIVKANLRTLSDMGKLRLCTRTQGEYQTIFREIRERVIEVHPWAEDFIEVHCVAHGVCAFPNFQDCPIKGPIFNPDTGNRWDGAAEQIGDYDTYDIYKTPATRAEIKAAWNNLRPKEPCPVSGA